MSEFVPPSVTLEQLYCGYCLEFNEETGCERGVGMEKKHALSFSCILQVGVSRLDLAKIMIAEVSPALNLCPKHFKPLNAGGECPHGHTVTVPAVAPAPDAFPIQRPPIQACPHCGGFILDDGMCARGHKP